ncbi:hypothetical protein GCM10009623_14560 [Nocardioides aestuarii]|uniref:Uncharacterized protein n=1 Tax=Nocardioides aestuarii TaxID=252231 RepID=A0ABW4TJJ5_9ACTN
MTARDEVADPDQQGHLGAQEIHRDLCDPAGSADVAVDNRDWADPRIVDVRRRHPV